MNSAAKILQENGSRIRNPFFSIILVNYNNSDDTISCVSQLMNQTFLDFEIVIVENNSNEYNKRILNDFLNNNTNKITLYNTEENLGFAAGNNFGIKKSKGKYIFILNSDTYFSKTLLEEIYYFISKNPSIKIIGPKILYKNTGKIWSIGGRIDFRNPLICNMTDENKPNYDMENPFLVDMLPGCALIVKRDVFRRIGLFDPNYFMYWEDTDLCFRAKNMGYKLILNPSITVFHDVDAFEKVDSKYILGYLFRNRIIFIFKHGNLIQKIAQIIFTPIHFFLYLFNFKARKPNFNLKIKLAMLIQGFRIGLSIALSKKIQIK